VAVLTIEAAGSYTGAVPAFLEVWRPGGAQLVALDAERVSLGRAPTSDVVLDDLSVSRLHAVLERYAGGWCVRDLGSANGTLVNGERVVGESNLKAGDELHLGSSRMVFRDDRPADLGTTATAKPPPRLTPREREILIALCGPLLGGDPFNQPATIRQLAEQFVVTEAAVKFHFTNLYDKFEIYETAGEPRRFARPGINADR
jgi:hypothetical protein